MNNLIFIFIACTDIEGIFLSALLFFIFLSASCAAQQLLDRIQSIALRSQIQIVYVAQKAGSLSGNGLVAPF